MKKRVNVGGAKSSLERALVFGARAGNKAVRYAVHEEAQEEVFKMTLYVFALVL